MSIKDYQKAQEQVTDPRLVEIMMFQRCNSLMAAAKEGRYGPGGADDPLAASKSRSLALQENDKLWIAMIADLASEANQLPAQLRAGLISLGFWAQRYANRVRFEKAPFDPLIQLNNQIIDGLRASIEAGRASAVDPAAAATLATAPIIA